MDAEMVAPAGIIKDDKAWVREIYKAATPSCTTRSW